jgi:predicted aldo/keto reductase-like oxidoreductase
MPINILDYHYRSFARLVVPEANKRGVGVIGMKRLGGGSNGMGRFIANKVCTVQEATNYALSQPIASLVVGIDSMKVLEQDLKIGREFKPMSEAEQTKLRDRTKEVAGDGRHERFKSTQLFDGPYHRVQHGLTEKEVLGT